VARAKTAAKVRRKGERERAVERAEGGPQRVSSQLMIAGVKVLVAGGRVDGGWPAFYASMAPSIWLGRVVVVVCRASEDLGMRCSKVRAVVLSMNLAQASERDKHRESPLH
jgi:hypothetical protein